MRVKGAKPGRYTPKCSRCGKAFIIEVSEGSSSTLQVTPLEGASASGSGVPAKSSPVVPAPPRPSASGKGLPAEKAAPHEKKPPEPKAPTTPAGSTGPDLDTTFPTLPGSANPGAEVSKENRLPPALGDSARSGAALAVCEPTAPDEVEDTPPPTVVSEVRAVPVRVRKREVPATLDGYQVITELGHGGMGAVYLARQLSLDRRVALKIMNPLWAQNATFVARFTREAYAAAQLVHHNVVQIYDIGSDRGVHYFSMEFIEGRSLGHILKTEGKLDVEVAVGYVLQAARGLKFAHDRGMIHRDIKPDNLLLNTQGIVKVADLGLVKTPEAFAREQAGDGTARPPSALPLASTNVTLAGTAMGTPAYMAPEQARDAATVDARADIYSLGCTLYTLVTGRPLFEGKTVLDVLRQHAFDPVVRPDAIVKRVPTTLSDIILRMVAKKPEDRYANLGEVIKELEDFLGVQSSGPFTPREEHATLLEECVKRFNDAPASRFRNRAMLSFFGSCALLFVVCVLFQGWRLAGGFATLAVLTPLCYFLVSGFLQRTHLFGKVRELARENSLLDWLTWAAVVVLIALLLYLLGFLLAGIAFGALALILAVGFYMLADRPLARQQQQPLAKAEEMLRSMRLHGLEEEALRQFVCKYSGERWEAFYEALFGYEAKLTARARWGLGTQGRLRQKYGAWRDPVAHWLEMKQRQRREAREKKHLQAVEEKNLQAQGLNADEARERAERAAEVLVQKAAEIKELANRQTSLIPEATLVPEEPQDLVSAGALLELPEQPAPRPGGRRRRTGVLGSLFGLVLGARMRFLVGTVLIVGCVAWMYQNGLIPGHEIKNLAEETIQSKDLLKVSHFTLDLSRETQPLSLPLVPGVLTEWFRDFNPGVAGLMLIASVFFRGVFLTLLVWCGAALAFAGQRLGIPAMGPLSAQTLAMAGGGVLAVLGFLCRCREKE
jgi:serine/threonine protein kinase/membrane protein implicated in regulation of membrane protease activity